MPALRVVGIRVNSTGVHDGCKLQPAYSDFPIIDYDKCTLPICGRQIGQQARYCFLRFFDSRRPDAQPDDAVVSAQGVHAGIGEIFIIGYDDGPIFLGPSVQKIIGTAGKAQVIYVEDLPCGAFLF